MKNALLNHTAVKRYILSRLEEKRPHLQFTRVSESAILQLEIKMRDILDKAIWNHPSRGKTFMGIE